MKMILQERGLTTLSEEDSGKFNVFNDTRPNIMYFLSLIIRYIKIPREAHLLDAKRILMYLQGTIDFSVLYKKESGPDLIGFINSDYAVDKDDRKRTSGYVLMFGSGVILWCSKKHPIVTLSTR